MESTILKKISGQDFGERNYQAGEEWLENNKQSSS